MAEVGDGPIAMIVGRIDKTRDQFIDEMFENFRAEVHGLDYDTRMTDLWRASLTENVIAAIHYLQRDVPMAMLEAPAAALAYFRAAAQRDVPLAPLVRVHRLGLAGFLEVAMQHASALDPAVQAGTIIELVRRANHLFDVVADQLILAYEEEHDLWLSRHSGLKQQWIGHVLADTPIDLPRAEKALRYRLDGRHLAAVVWADAAVAAGDVVAQFDKVRSVLAEALGPAANSLMVPTDEHEARLWFTPLRPREPADLRATLKSAGISARVAFGRIEQGLHGFRATCGQAERAKTVAIAGCDRFGERVVFYQDLVPVALMASNVDELRRFVIEVLGELGVDDERGEWLRETLRQFLARNRSFVATADAMTLHRNTIQYRVTQAMELCGQSFDDPDSVFKVQIALEACRWMAPSVLTP